MKIGNNEITHIENGMLFTPIEDDWDNEDYEYFKEWDIEQYKKEIERLNNIIKKAIEFINGGKGWKKYKYTHQEQKLLQILQGSGK